MGNLLVSLYIATTPFCGMLQLIGLEGMNARLKNEGYKRNNENRKFNIHLEDLCNFLLPFRNIYRALEMAFGDDNDKIFNKYKTRLLKKGEISLISTEKEESFEEKIPTQTIEEIKTDAELDKNQGVSDKRVLEEQMMALIEAREILTELGKNPEEMVDTSGRNM